MLAFALLFVLHSVGCSQDGQVILKRVSQIESTVHTLAGKPYELFCNLTSDTDSQKSYNWEKSSEG